MRRFRVIWDDDDEPDGNVRHIAEHDLMVEDIEYVLENPMEESYSDSTGRPCCFGYTPAGDYIIVVFEIVEDDVYYPVTAYETPEPR